MKDTHKIPNPKISLEQLLHVKRAERPDSSFWGQFDQEFRRRQLAALVSIRPWYVKLGHASIVVLRKTAPAAAVVVAAALGIVVYQGKPDEANPTPAATSGTDASTETALVVLPEEQFLSNRDSVVADQPVRTAGVTVREQPRFATLELNSSASRSSNFTTVTSPYAFAAAANDSGMYVVNDLTTGPVMHMPTSPAGNL